MMRRIIPIFLFLVCASASAAPASARFRKPPADAPKWLKATVGKQFSSGFVFVNGQYVAPPYKVERYGNVIRINKIQVTNQIVPWSEFVKTQGDGAGDEARAPESSVRAGVPPHSFLAPSSVPRPLSSAEDDLDVSIDDILDEIDGDDETSSPSPAPAPDDAPPPPGETPPQDEAGDAPPSNPPLEKPDSPQKTVKRRPAEFKGEYVNNAKSKALIARVNAYRTKIDSHLRSGGYIFFGTRYKPVFGSAEEAKRLVARLPEAMQRSTGVAAFENAMRQAAFSHLPRQIVEELFSNRIDYTRLLERRRQIDEVDKWSNMLKR